MGSVANMVIQPWGALLIGFLAGFISVVGYKFISVSTIVTMCSTPDKVLIEHTEWLGVPLEHRLRIVKTGSCMVMVVAL